MSRCGPYTAVYMTRYTAVHGRVPVDTCTRPYTCPVHGRVHGPYTLHVHGRRRPCRRPVHSHVHGWCRRAVCTAHTRRCAGRVYGTAVYGPCIRHGRYTAVCVRFSRAKTCSRAVYTRPPCNGHTTRYTAVFTTRYTAVYTAHVHGPYAAAQWPSGRPLTARARPCNCRVDFPCTPYTWRCNGCVHVSRAYGPCRRPVYTAAYIALTFTRPVHGDNSASK